TATEVETPKHKVEGHYEDKPALDEHGNHPSVKGYYVDPMTGDRLPDQAQQSVMPRLRTVTHLAPLPGRGLLKEDVPLPPKAEEVPLSLPPMPRLRRILPPIVALVPDVTKPEEVPHLTPLTPSKEEANGVPLHEPPHGSAHEEVPGEAS
ncbi:MAG: hypothetical protein ACHREM_18005, partial [Polyangiales bacterium]